MRFINRSQIICTHSDVNNKRYMCITVTAFSESINCVWHEFTRQNKIVKLWMSNADETWHDTIWIIMKLSTWISDSTERIRPISVNTDQLQNSLSEKSSQIHVSHLLKSQLLSLTVTLPTKECQQLSGIYKNNIFLKKFSTIFNTFFLKCRKNMFPF